MALKKASTQKRIFVIMPFVQTPTRDQEQLTSFFEDNIKRPIEEASLDCEYKVWRSGETFNITDEIIKDLFRADIVIADLSGEYPNPNVMYELGVRLTLSDKPVILIREKNPNNKKVFDVDSYYIHPYDPLKYSDLERHLVEKLRRFEKGEEQFESPVKKVLHNELILSQSALNSLSMGQQKDIVLRGAKFTEKLISSSIGPFGSGLPITDKSGDNILAKKGSEICQAAWSSNPLENRGIEFLTEVGRSMIHKVGDGSKIAILIAYRMMEAGNQALKKGYLPKNIVRGMEKAVNEAVEYINQNTFLLKSKSDVVNIASTAAKNEAIGQIIADSLEAVGKYGIILFERSESKDTRVETIEGIQFDRGYISVDFVTNPDTTSWDFDECYLLLYPKVISSYREIIPLMEKLVLSDCPLLIIAEDVRDEALDTLILNAQKNVMQSVAVKLPRSGNRGIEILEDIAIKTGGKIVSSSHGLSLSNIDIADLGKAEKVIVTGEFCRIIGGKGNVNEVKARIKRIDETLESTSSAFEKEKYQERLAMLMGATAIVHVGGVTRQDINEKWYGFGSALNSAVAAISYGAVPGEGLTFLRAKEKVSTITPENHEEAAGIEGVAKSLEAPIARLIKNSNLITDQILDSLRMSQENHIGFNIESGNIEDLVKRGIIDPASVLKTALDVALVHSKMFLETSSWGDQKSEDLEH